MKGWHVDVAVEFSFGLNLVFFAFGNDNECTWAYNKDLGTTRDTWCIYYPDLFKKSRLQVNKLWQVLFHEVCPYYYAMKIMISNSNKFLLEIMTFYAHWFSLIRQKLL